MTISAYTKANITGGGFQDSSGNPIANGYLTFQLSHDSNITTFGAPNGSQVAAGIQVTLLLDTIGNLCRNQFLWTNDQLQPSGSYYTVNLYNSQGLLVWAFPQVFEIQPYQPTINIGSVQPTIP